MITMIAAALAAAAPAPSAPDAQAQHQQHGQMADHKKECCADCCDDMAKKHEGDAAAHADHGRQ